MSEEEPVKQNGVHYDGVDGKKELGELTERHRLSKSRADALADELEAGNAKLKQLIETYHKSDQVLNQSRLR